MHTRIYNHSLYPAFNVLFSYQMPVPCCNMNRLGTVGIAVEDAETLFLLLGNNSERRRRGKKKNNIKAGESLTSNKEHTRRYLTTGSEPFDDAANNALSPMSFLDEKRREGEKSRREE